MSATVELLRQARAEAQERLQSARDIAAREEVKIQRLTRAIEEIRRLEAQAERSAS